MNFDVQVFTIVSVAHAASRSWDCCAARCRWSADGYGKLTGVVIDPAGTPQMGATILLTAETADGPGAALLTNQNGVFSSAHLRPGLYSVSATLAGFLPTMEQHVSVSANLRPWCTSNSTRFLPRSISCGASGAARRKRRLEMGAADLGGVRPVLQLRDGTVIIADDNSRNADMRKPSPRGLEMTNGSCEPGSSSALPGTLTTAVSYDQSLGTRAGC